MLCMSLIFNSSLLGQDKSSEEIPKDIIDCLTEIGKDNVSTLNECESKYLNHIFQKEKGVFDFCNKKVAFFKGNIGSVPSTKKEYFDDEKYYINLKGVLPLYSDQLIIFNEDESSQIEYNAAIISNSKKLLSKKEVVRRLKRKR